MIVLHCLLRLIKTLLSSFRDHSPPFPASTWTRSLLLFRLFPSSLGQVPKQTSQNNKTRTICRTLATIQTDLVRFNTHTYLSYNCILEGGGGGGSYFPLATYVRNDNHPSRWAICSQGWNEGSADMHMPEKRWQLSPQVVGAMQGRKPTL